MNYVIKFLDDRARFIWEVIEEMIRRKLEDYVKDYEE